MTLQEEPGVVAADRLGGGLRRAMPEVGSGRTGTREEGERSGGGQEAWEANERIGDGRKTGIRIPGGGQ